MNKYALKPYKYAVNLKRKSGNKSLRQGNEMISENDNMYHRVKADIVQHLRHTAHKNAKSLDNPFCEERPCTVNIVIHPPTARKMDPPNWNPTVKPIIDGLVDAGVLVDDNYNVIKRYSFEMGELSNEKGAYRIEITIEDYK